MALGGSLAGTAKAVLTVDTSQFDRGLTEAQGRFHRNVTEIEHDSERMSRGVLAGSGAFSHLGRSIAFASGTFLGAAGFTQVVRESIGEASSLNKAIERTGVVFGANARQIEAWSETTAKSMGLARGDALNAADSFGALFKAMGITGNQSIEMSKSLVRLSTDIGALKNVDSERVLGALTTGIAGRTRGLREFGIVIDQAQVKEEAYRLGLVKTTVSSQAVADANTKVQIAEGQVVAARAKYGENTTQVASAELRLQKAREAVTKATQGSGAALDQHAKALATYSLIMKQTSDAQGQFSRHSGDLAEQQKILRAEVTDLEEKLGKALLPQVTNIVKAMTNWLGNTRNQREVQHDLNQVVKIATGLAQTLGGVIKTAAGIFKTFAGEVGGSKNALEILLGLMVARKVATYGSAVSDLAGNFRSMAGAIRLANRRAGGLLGSLTNLGKIAATGIVIGIELDVIRKALGAGAMTGLSKSGDSVPVWNGQQWVDPATGKAVQDQAFWNKQFGAGTPSKGQGAYGGGGTGLPSVPAAAATRGIGAALTATAKSALGVPYQYGGAPSLSKPTDCSGLMVAVFAKNGITNLPRTSQEQYAQAPIKNAKPLLPGDLVFSEGVHPGHVGMYIGDGNVLEDPHTGDHVKIIPLSAFGWNGESARWWGGKASTGVGGGGGTSAVAGTSAVGTSATKTLHVGTTPKTPPQYDPIPTSLQVDLARAGTTRTTSDDLAVLRRISAALRREGLPRGADNQIAYFNAIRDINDQIAGLTKTKGAELLPLNLQQALAHAGTTRGATDDIKAFDNAIAFVNHRLAQHGLAQKSKIKLEKLLKQLEESRNKLIAPIEIKGLSRSLPRLPSITGVTTQIGNLQSGHGTQTVNIPGIGKILTAFSLTPTVGAWNKILGELKKKYAAASKRLKALRRSLAKARKAKFPNKTLIAWLEKQIGGLGTLMGTIKTDIGTALGEISQLRKDAADKAQQDADEADTAAEGGAANIPVDIQQALADAEARGDVPGEVAALGREADFLQGELTSGTVTTADGRVIALTPEARLDVTRTLTGVRQQITDLTTPPTPDVTPDVTPDAPPPPDVPDPNQIPVDLRLALVRAQGTPDTADDLTALQGEKTFITGRIAATTDPELLIGLTGSLNDINDQIGKIVDGQKTVIDNQVTQIDQAAQFQEFFTGLRGLRGFESNILGSALGGSLIQVTNYFAQGPEDPHTFSAGVSFELRALVG